MACSGAGLVEIEEGELTGKQLNLQTHALARISFAKEPHVQQVCLSFSRLYLLCLTFSDFFIIHEVTSWLLFFFYPHSRFPECFSWGQMVGLSRRFPWQQTTSHWWHSTCTSLTVDHSEPTIYLAVIYGETERFDEQPCLMLTIYTLLINIILYINVCWMESGVQVSQLWVMFHLKPLIFGYWTERGKCI